VPKKVQDLKPFSPDYKKMLFALAKSYLFFSLFSLISSLEKSRGEI